MLIPVVISMFVPYLIDVTHKEFKFNGLIHNLFSEVRQKCIVAS